MIERLLHERAERDEGVIIKAGVGEVQSARRKCILQREVVILRENGENIAESVFADDHGTDFELFICHKITTRQHLTTWAGTEQG